MSDRNKVESFSAQRIASATAIEDEELEEVEDVEVPDVVEEVEDVEVPDVVEEVEDVLVEEIVEDVEEVQDQIQEMDVEELEEDSAQDTTSADTHIEGMNILKKLADLSSTFMSAGKTESAIKLADVIQSSVGDLINPATAKATKASVEEAMKIPDKSSKKTL